MTERKLITQEELYDIFDIDLANGRLFWKRSPNRKRQFLQGAEAGSLHYSSNDKLYWVVGVNWRFYKRGRLMFLARHGRWPMPCVDHIDGNGLNDSEANLREATFLENARNHRPYRKKSGLPAGVSQKASGRFAARIGLERKVLNLGTFATAEEAHSVYVAKRKELFHEFS